MVMPLCINIDSGRGMTELIFLSTSQHKYLFSVCNLPCCSLSRLYFTKKKKKKRTVNIKVCFLMRHQGSSQSFAVSDLELSGLSNTFLLQKQNSLSVLHGSYNKPGAAELSALCCRL